MIDEVDKKLAEAGLLPPAATNGELFKVVTDFTIEVESISTSIDIAIRCYNDNQSLGGGNLQQLKAMTEKVNNLGSILLRRKRFSPERPSTEAFLKMKPLLCCRSLCRCSKNPAPFT